MHTGDVAVIGSHRHVRIVDRIKDMYISGGENVYPQLTFGVLDPEFARRHAVGGPEDLGEV